MTLITMEGFDNLLSVTETTAGLGWTCTDPSGLGPGRFAGQCYQFSDRNAPLYKQLPSNYSAGFTGFAFQMPQLGSTLILALNDAGTTQVLIALTSTGIISAYLSSVNGPLLGSVTLAGFASLAWNYIEVGYIIDPSAGAIDVRINGAAALSLTGINTRSSSNSYVSVLEFATGYPGNPVSIDDFYFCDNTGAAPGNTFLGDVRVQTLRPAAAGTHTQFTPLSGSNVSQVSETLMDSDSSYNFSTTPGQLDTFTVSTLSAGTASVLGVRLKASVRKDDAGSRTMQTRVRSGAAEQGGAIAVMTSSYTYVTDLYPTDPSTGAAWTPAGVNGMEIGYECVS